MGGKTWTRAEELYFWKTGVIPYSEFRVGIDKAVNPGKTFKTLAMEMQAAMRADGVPDRRQYTELSLYEHFYQNAVKLRYSPQAYDLVTAYLRKVRDDEAADAAAGITPPVTIGTTANITASTTANTTASTTANTTASTTAEQGVWVPRICGPHRRRRVRRAHRVRRAKRAARSASAPAGPSTPTNQPSNASVSAALSGILNTPITAGPSTLVNLPVTAGPSTPVNHSVIAGPSTPTESTVNLPASITRSLPNGSSETIHRDGRKTLRLRLPSSRPSYDSIIHHPVRSASAPPALSSTTWASTSTALPATGGIALSIPSDASHTSSSSGCGESSSSDSEDPTSAAIIAANALANMAKGDNASNGNAFAT